MKLQADIKIKNIILHKFEWESAYFQLILDIKNNYPIKIKLEDLELNLINSIDEKFAYIECSNIIIKSKETKEISFDIKLYNKEAVNLINNFINNKESVFKAHILKGKLQLFSILPINLHNKTKNIDILDLIKYLYEK